VAVAGPKSEVRNQKLEDILSFVLISDFCFLI